jgi:hypothetical protein
VSSVTKSIDVSVPVSTAYNQWTQFELFPQFIDGVKEVHQIDDKRLHWRAEVGGKEQEWVARILQRIPDQRIAWTSVAGDMNGGAVDFHHICDNQTRITLTLDDDPQGFLESVGAALRFMDRRVDGDLKHFKQFIESRGAEPGGWRGAIEGSPRHDAVARSAPYPQEPPSSPTDGSFSCTLLVVVRCHRRQIHSDQRARLWQLVHANRRTRWAMVAHLFNIGPVHFVEVAHVLEKNVDVQRMP